MTTLAHTAGGGAHSAKARHAALNQRRTARCLRSPRGRTAIETVLQRRERAPNRSTQRTTQASRLSTCAQEPPAEANVRRTMTCRGAEASRGTAPRTGRQTSPRCAPRGPCQWRGGDSSGCSTKWCPGSVWPPRNMPMPPVSRPVRRPPVGPWLEPHLHRGARDAGRFQREVIQVGARDRRGHVELRRKLVPLPRRRCQRAAPRAV